MEKVSADARAKGGAMVAARAIESLAVEVAGIMETRAESRRILILINRGIIYHLTCWRKAKKCEAQ